MTAAVVVRWLEDGALREGALSDVAAALACGCAWVDVRHPDDATLEALCSAFGLHPLAIEDVLHDDQRPKLEVYDGNLFFVWRVPEGIHGETVKSTELDVFLGHGWLITAHAGTVPAIDELAKDPAAVMARGPEWTLHAILDRAVDEVFPVIDGIGDELDDLGDALLDHVDRAALAKLHRTKRLLLAAHKVIGPERDALRELEREQAYVSEEAYRYFQDVSDHLARVADSIDTYRDVASSVMDVYLSAVSNQLNQVMKRLTVVATVFMPGTLIVGIYGMNLHLWPEPASPVGAPVALGLTVVITAGMLWWFKRSEWW